LTPSANAASALPSFTSFWKRLTVTELLTKGERCSEQYVHFNGDEMMSEISHSPHMMAPQHSRRATFTPFPRGALFSRCPLFASKIIGSLQPLQVPGGCSWHTSRCAGLVAGA